MCENTKYTKTGILISVMLQCPKSFSFFICCHNIQKLDVISFVFCFFFNETWYNGCNICLFHVNYIFRDRKRLLNCIENDWNFTCNATFNLQCHPSSHYKLAWNSGEASFRTRQNFLKVIKKKTTQKNTKVLFNTENICKSVLN